MAPSEVKKLVLTSYDELLQRHLLEAWLPGVGTQPWQKVRESRGVVPKSFAVWCALMTDEAATRAMTRDGWDLLVDDGRPGWVQHGGGAKGTATYLPFGRDDGLRPFVLAREFYGAFARYVEVIEEFRLFHNLAPTPGGDVLTAWDESGYPVDAVRLGPDMVEVNMAFLLDFQAATRLHFAVFVDSYAHCPVPVDEIPEAIRKHEVITRNLRVCRVIAADIHGKQHGSFSRVLGKVILPPPQRKSFGPTATEVTGSGKPVPFVVGLDADGAPVLASGAGKSTRGADSDCFKTVFFRREVLAKYYEQPERFTVTDGLLECLGLWSCPIDNDHPTHVVVYLDDLWRRLPYREQLHWREHNILPEGQISDTAYQRNVLGYFISGKSPDFVFRTRYREVNQLWAEAFGWPLFTDSNPGDSHLLKTIRVLTSESQPEFDQQVLFLTKLLVDHLNDKQLRAASVPLQKDAKSIEKLAVFLQNRGVEDAEVIVKFLRGLQRVRSKLAAYKKGSDYEQALVDLGLDPATKREAFRKLLLGALRCLDELEVVCEM